MRVEFECKITDCDFKGSFVLEGYTEINFLKSSESKKEAIIKDVVKNYITNIKYEIK